MPSEISRKQASKLAGMISFTGYQETSHARIDHGIVYSKAGNHIDHAKVYDKEHIYVKGYSPLSRTGSIVACPMPVNSPLTRKL